MEDTIFGITSLKQYKGKFVIVQDSQFTIKLFDVDELVESGVASDPKKLSHLEITQRPKGKDDRQDIYFGDNKLIELRNSNYGKTKKWFSTFVLSCISTTRKVNLYVIEMHIKRKYGFFSCKKSYKFSYQFLKSFKFDYSPTSVLELGEDKIAVATGKYIKVLDIKGSKEAGIMYEGHLDRIRSLTKITKKVKAYLVRDNKKKKSIVKDAHYIISAGSDMQIRIWKVPVVWPSSKLNVINEAWDPDKEDNCLMAIETKHTDMISAIIYSNEEIITASKDWNVKMYRIQSSKRTGDDKPDDQTLLVGGGNYADADLN